MEATITIGQLAQIVLFALIVAVGVYAAFILRRINAFTRRLDALFSENEVRLKETVAHLARLMENSAELSAQFREGFGEARQTLKIIGRETADTVLTINKTADHVATYAVVIHEVVKSLLKMFTAQGRK